MPELDETATIRPLPDGQACPARIRWRETGQIVLVLPDEVATVPDGAFRPGMLVEVQSAQAVFLGEIVSLEPGTGVIVSVEHFLDRAALEQIGRFWSAG